VRERHFHDFVGMGGSFGGPVTKRATETVNGDPLTRSFHARARAWPCC
jgi:hypothetical protein